MSWKQVARALGVSWEQVFPSVRSTVRDGLAHRDWSNIEAIGVAEAAYRKGRQYLTRVYRIDEACRRGVRVSEDRTVRHLLGFFRTLGPKRSSSIRSGCSDLWRAYLQVIAKKRPHATPIVDRSHIVANPHKALDQVPAAEAKRLKVEGDEPHLHKTRGCLLKREVNLTDPTPSNYP